MIKTFKDSVEFFMLQRKNKTGYSADMAAKHMFLAVEPLWARFLKIKFELPEKKLIKAFSEKQNLDLLLSMNAFTNPDFNRDLVLFCKSKDAHDALFAYLQDNGLELTPLDFPVQKQGDSGFIGFYKWQ